MELPAPRAPSGLQRLLQRDGVVPLVSGVAVALVFTLAPTLRFMGWFVRALFHETGHVAVAWFSGCPAFPAIDLRGHAVAIHHSQQGVIAGLVGILLAWLAVLAWRSGRHRALASIGLLLWIPATFSSGFREVLGLSGGHVGELAFAWLFLRRASTGEGVERGPERPLYAGLGWYFVGSNALLAAGLLFSTAARAAYASNGSFGLENDYLRLARELGVSVGLVGAAMALASLAVVPLALLRWAPGEDGGVDALRPIRW